ncbi:MAG: carboxymuconolactone decarboxylase family protein [Flavobacteriales bacterium]
MPNEAPKIGNALKVFFVNAPEQAQAWIGAIHAMDKASTLDAKTQQLVCLGIAAALVMEDGVAPHAQGAKKAGADRSGVISTIMAALPAAGQGFLEVLPKTLEAFDAA